MQTLTTDSREQIKANVIAWVKSEMPKAPLFQQKSIVTETLKVIKSRDEWSLEQFSIGRRAAVEVFMARFSAVLDVESIANENALGELLEEFEGHLGSDFIDSSGLPLLEGSYKAINYGFSLRADWFNGLRSEQLDAAKKEILENRTASYWINKLK
jgi:hypothetical protein